MLTQDCRSIQQIEELAESKLAECGITSIPVNPAIIADIEGISIYDANFQNPDVSGLISKEKDRVVIYVRHSDIPARKRFTVAHELGHLFLHLADSTEGNRVDTVMFRSDGYLASANSYEEVEANRFAAALLMPRRHMVRERRLHDSIEDLALLFGVSVQAMTIRLKTLDELHG